MLVDLARLRSSAASELESRKWAAGIFQIYGGIYHQGLRINHLLKIP